MKKYLRFIPLYILPAGVAGCLLRQAMFAAADRKGLIPSVHPANTPLILLSVVALALLALYGVFCSGRDMRLRLSFPLQAIGCLAAAGAHFYIFLTANHTMLLFTALQLAVSILFLALAFYRVRSKKPPLLLFALICTGMMILCFGQYRQWSRYTQPQQYLFPALSALSTALYSLELCYMELPERNNKKTFILNQAALFSTLVSITPDNLIYNLGICLWLVSGLFCTPCKMTLPQDVRYLMDKLERAGFTVYAVGGCVRDALLELTPHDYDLCTNAVPEQICQVFSDHQLVRSGEKHGTVGVVMEHTVYEITTYRTEGSYSDNRHPDAVTFVDRIEDDLARRDFTVNAMAYHPKTGYTDPFGGQKDLQNGILRAVGQPETRFQEDALRILRGVRFACRFRLTPEQETMKAMKRLSPLMDHLAKERVYSELTQILCLMEGKDLITYREMILQVIPELRESVRFMQHNPHHAYDVYTHTAYVLSATDGIPALRWAALLHDVGKPQTFTQDEKGVGHFYGHAQESAKIANEILHRLKAPTSLREQVVFLVEHHMDNFCADKNTLRKQLSKYGSENLRLLIALHQADRGGKGTGKRGRTDRRYEKLLRLLDQLEAEEGRLQIRDLAIDGHDLLALGFESGPALGDCQKQLLELVLSGEIPNEKEPLTQKAREILNR